MVSKISSAFNYTRTPWLCFGVLRHRSYERGISISCPLVAEGCGSKGSEEDFNFNSTGSNLCPSNLTGTKRQPKKRRETEREPFTSSTNKSEHKSLLRPFNSFHLYIEAVEPASRTTQNSTVCGCFHRSPEY
eukprot:scaffold6655_cov169-Amphora_coffeaeformis.AAC.4